MELGCAMTWNQDEQFVEGDFPFYPYANRMYADTGDGLTDARIRSNDFSGFKTALNRKGFQEKRQSLYAFNKDSNKLIDATKVDSDEAGSFESAQPRKQDSVSLGRLHSAEPRHLDVPEKLNLVEHEPKSAESEKLEPAGPENIKSTDSEKSHLLHGSEKSKLGTNMLSRNHKKVAEMEKGKSRVPSPTILEKRPIRNSELEANLAWSQRSIGESNSPGRHLRAHGIPSNFMPSVSSSKRKFAREDKPNDKGRKITLVAPYETNFTVGGFRSVNPSSWLAKEIERFIRRKDHRWLDFMKNTGMDVKKYSGAISDTKRKYENTNTKKTPCVDCLHPSSAPTGLDDPAKLKTDLLVNRIDSLLADLNQFRSSVKNGWSDINSVKKTREFETGLKLTNDDIMDRRKHRLRRGIRLSRIPAFTRPPAQPSTASDSMENDLRDLRKNVVLYQNRLPEEEMMALEDMKLHIKVYMEKEKNNEKEDQRASGNDMDYYD